VTLARSYTAGTTLLAQSTYHYDQANRLYQTDRLAKQADLLSNLGDGTKADTVWRDEEGRVVEHSGDICGCSNYVHVYDAVGRSVTSKDPMGATDATRNLVISAYDKNGNVTKSTRKERSQASGVEADKDLVTTFVYDARDRRITKKEQLTSSMNAETVYFYGLRDQLTKVVDGNGDEVRTEYDEQVLKVKEILENGTADVVTEYVYDDDNRLLTYRAKNSATGDQETVYSYDQLDRVVTTTWPDAGQQIVSYDVDSNRISTTDPNGTVVVCAYDKNDRLTSKAMTLASHVVGPTSLTFGYDGMDRRTQAERATL